jgi:ABC-type polysaccharide/polyol phosphate export permease
MKKSLGIALNDLFASARNWPLWIDLAWRDIRLRYVRTIIGPFWLTLSSGIFIFAFGLIYANLFKQELQGYLPYLTAGFLPWILVSTNVVESCKIFTADKAAITNWPFPYLIMVYRLICRNLIIFFHNLVILVFVCLMYGPVPTWNLLWIPLSLTLVCLNGLWIGVFMATICVRFRDIEQLVVSLMQITMFVTPIFWKPEMLSGRGRAAFVDGNFFYHMIEILRAPLLGHAPTAFSLTFVIVTATIGLFFTLWFYGRFRRRIPFWV